MKSKKLASLELAKICRRVLDDKKAEDIQVLDVSEQSSITNFLVVATATSTPHLRALRVELEKAIDASKNRIVGIETADESGWTVIDAFDVMVHLFFAEKRKQYGLENLWKDAAVVPKTRLPGVAKPAKKKPVARPKRPAKKGLGARNR